MRLALTALALFLTASVAAQTSSPGPPADTKTPARPAYESDLKFVATMAEAKDLAKKHQYPFAAEGFKKANKIAGGGCFACLRQLYDLDMHVGEYKDAVAAATQMGALATLALEKSVAANDRGAALLAQGGEKPKPAQLEAAHDAFQSALSVYPKNLSALYRDGCVLARMGRNDEASKDFSACAEAVSRTDPMRARAMHFAENPILSTYKMAPAFEVTALDGSRFNLDNMGGRVVLIDSGRHGVGPVLRSYLICKRSPRSSPMNP